MSAASIDTGAGMDPRLQERRVAVMRSQGQRRLRLVLAAALLVTAVILFLWLVRSPLLDVDEVQVSGNAQTSSQAVLDAAAVESGVPLVDLDLSDSRQAVAELPWVDEVTTSRNLDGTVEIRISEREPVAAVRGEAEWMLVDANGRVLDLVTDVPAGVDVVTGPGWTAIPGGWVSESVLGGVEVAAQLPAGLESAVASVQVSDGAVDLVLFGGGVLNLGPAVDLEAKFLAALSVLEYVDQYCLNRLDVRVSSAPVLTRVPDCS